MVFPGSIHPETGKPYQAINGLDIENIKVNVAPMPDWLYELLESNQSALDERYPNKYKK